MRMLSLLLGLALLLSTAFAAEFAIAPYLYSAEKGAAVDYLTFQSGDSNAKVAKINGEESLLLLDGKLVTDKATIAGVMSGYYQANYYASPGDLAELKGYADRFNASRNVQTKYGPAEQICYTSGTFLAHKPCNDLASCIQTATMFCTITGSDGCMVDLLATHILTYKKSIDKLNDAYSKFSLAYSGFGPTTITDSLNSMDASFDSMKAAADEVSQSKLRQPEKIPCNAGCDSAHIQNCCLGVCPEAQFDYAAITAGKAKVASLRAKTQPFANLDIIVAKIALSTQDRINYKQGEEKAAIFAPKYNSSKAKYGGLKAQAVEAKALASDSNFVSVADAFLSKTEELDQRMEKRQFDGFDALLSGYESAGKSLSSMINNSTSAYRTALEAQDAAGDQILQAQWRVDRLSTASLASYNSLADRKNKLDAKFAPPMTAAQYGSLAGEYGKVESDTRTYVASSSTAADAVFSAGNTFGRASVDGAMSLVSSMVPISFKTRQSFARYVPPMVLGAIDLSILAVALLAFVAVFYHFHGFFKSRIAISGWLLAMLGFMLMLVVGSVGFYSIVLSNERATSFYEFFGTIRASDRAAVIVDRSGATDPGAQAMSNCADQLEAQLSVLGKKTLKYYISGDGCSYRIPKPTANNSTSAGFEVKSGLSAANCLDSIPDVPVFDLKYSSENQVPVFTTVVAKQALIKGNEAYYAKNPMCDIANVLN